MNHLIVCALAVFSFATARAVTTDGPSNPAIQGSDAIRPCVESGSAEPAPAAGAAPADLKQKLKASRAKWEDAKKAANGNYEYAARFQSFTGYGWECTIVVRNGQVVERRYQAFSRMPGSEPPVAWTEHGNELGSHSEGVPLRTMDQIYDEAARILDQPSSARMPRWIYQENGAGLLLACGWIDQMIPDDSPFTGVRIAKIQMGNANDK